MFAEINYVSMELRRRIKMEDGTLFIEKGWGEGFDISIYVDGKKHCITDSKDSDSRWYDFSGSYSIKELIEKIRKLRKRKDFWEE